MSYIDLHMHSIVSNDGQYTSKELVERAHRLGIKIMAIADHDSISAIDEGLKCAKEYGIKLIPAIEISSEMNDGTPLHILGLNINHKDPRFIEREKTIRSICQKSANDFMNAALNVGFKFDKQAALAKANDGVVTEEMIAETILADHRNDDDPRLFEYRAGGIKSDNPGFNFYKEFYGKKDCPCYVKLPNANMNIKDVSELIHSTGGKMVLAHPAYNIQRDIDKLNEISTYGLDGIEVYSSYHNEEDIKFYEQHASRLNIIKTVGSDFHGKCKPAIEMGSVYCNEEEIIEGLRKITLID